MECRNASFSVWTRNDVPPRSLLHLQMHGEALADGIFSTFENCLDTLVGSLVEENSTRTRRSGQGSVPTRHGSPSHYSTAEEVRNLVYVPNRLSPFYQDALEAYLMSDDPTPLARRVMIQDITSASSLEGVDVNESSNDGISAIHVCALANDVSAAQRLFDAGANLEARTDYGETPMHIAAFYGNCEMMRFLLKNGASPHERCLRGETCAFYAATFNHLCILRILEECEVDFDTGRNDWWSPLHVAAVHGHFDTVKLLMKHCKYAQVDQVVIRTSRRVGMLMPSELARDLGHMEIYAFLRQHTWPFRECLPLTNGESERPKEKEMESSDSGPRSGLSGYTRQTDSTVGSDLLGSYDSEIIGVGEKSDNDSSVHK